MLHQMNVTDSEKLMLDVMRKTGITPHNVTQMAYSHAMKIQSCNLNEYKTLMDSLMRDVLTA